MLTKSWPNSSNIASASYDKETKVLTITFVRGAVYEYYEVPHDTWKQFKYVISPGKYFDAHIKKAFEYNKV